MFISKNLSRALVIISAMAVSSATLGQDDEQLEEVVVVGSQIKGCLLYTSPSPRDVEESRMPSSA